MKALFFVCLLALTNIPLTSPGDSDTVMIKDTRGAGLSRAQIVKAASAKSMEYLVIMTFADSEDYVKTVSQVAQEQFMQGQKKIYVLICDKPDKLSQELTYLVYKGNMSLPLTKKSDRSGADLSLLIMRVYNDHYLRD